MSRVTAGANRRGWRGVSARSTGGLARFTTVAKRGKNPIGTGINDLIAKAQNNNQALAGEAITVLGRVASVLVDLVLALVLAFFLLKDGPKFLPWVRGWIGPRFGRPVEEIASRSWTALGHFIWSQAAVAVADAVLIGVGIWLLGVPFALPIAILIFFGAFIPIVGAFVTGGVAVLVALVSGGAWLAAAILGVLVVVEQLEGNVMQPLIIGRTLKMHPALVISVITVGAALYGILGAFLSVPVLAVLTVIPRYVRETCKPSPERPSRPDRPSPPVQAKGPTPTSQAMARRPREPRLVPIPAQPRASSPGPTVSIGLTVSIAGHQADR